MSFQEAPPAEHVEEQQQPESHAQTQQHQQQPGSMDPTKYKTKLCRNFMQKSHCNFGATCMFAHGERDLQTYGLRPEGPRADPSKFKTKLCKHFATTGSCPFMDRCGFAHGQMELNVGAPGMHAPGPGPMVSGFQPAPYEGYFGLSPEMHAPLPQMKRPPVAELAKTRLCKHFSATGTCPYESRCLFAHGTGDLRPREQQGMMSLQRVAMQHHVPVVQHHVPVVPPAGQAWPWSSQYAYMPSS